MAVADVCRWGNRWYIATRFLDRADTQQGAVDLMLSAHGRLVSALVALVVAGVAATVGWRLRVLRGR